MSSGLEGTDKRIEKILIRHKAGLISMERSKQELAVLMLALKVYEDSVLEKKLQRLTEVLESKR